MGKHTIKIEVELDKLSPHTRVRLEYFYAAILDPEISNDRATNGLRAWKYSQAYRLTDLDNREIDHALNLVKKS